jgi:hypothetical protein
MAPLPTEQPAIRALGRSRTGCLPDTSWPLCQVSYKGEKASAQAMAVHSASPRTGACADASCPRRDSNAHCRSPRDRDSYRLVYEDMEPPPGVEPGLRPYGGRAAAVRGGMAGHPGLEPGNSGVRARRVCQIPPMATGAEDATRAHKPRGLGSRGMPIPSSRMVRHLGLEPRTRALRGRYSAIELAAHGAVPGSRTPMTCLEGKCLAVRPVRRGGSRR